MSVRLQLLLWALLSVVQLISAISSKCSAVCYLDENKRLSCTSVKHLTIKALHGEPIPCRRKEYSRSTEVIIGNFEDVDGINKNGLDILRSSEGKTSTYQLQLTLKLKIKVVEPGIFDKLDNLQRLQIHPYRVNPCAFYSLPKNLTQILLQCVSPKMQMLDDMYWPSDSKIEFKINMCLQKVSCYTCQPTDTTPYKYALLKSIYSGPLALNKRISLTSCEPGRCSPEVSICLPKATTTLKPTTTVTTTTKRAVTEITTTSSRPKVEVKDKSEAATSKKSNPKSSNSNYTPIGEKMTSETDNGLRPGGRFGKMSERTSDRESNNFFMYVLLGATGLNTALLLILVFVVLYATKCGRRKHQRGVFLMSKDTYPPEYSTLRPV